MVFTVISQLKKKSVSNTSVRINVWRILQPLPSTTLLQKPTEGLLKRDDSKLQVNVFFWKEERKVGVGRWAKEGGIEGIKERTWWILFINHVSSKLTGVGPLKPLWSLSIISDHDLPRKVWLREFDQEAKLYTKKKRSFSYLFYF